MAGRDGAAPGRPGENKAAGRGCGEKEGGWLAMGFPQIFSPGRVFSGQQRVLLVACGFAGDSWRSLERKQLPTASRRAVGRGGPAYHLAKGCGRAGGHCCAACPGEFWVANPSPRTRERQREDPEAQEGLSGSREQPREGVEVCGGGGTAGTGASSGSTTGGDNRGDVCSQSPAEDAQRSGSPWEPLSSGRAGQESPGCPTCAELGVRARPRLRSPFPLPPGSPPK